MFEQEIQKKLNDIIEIGLPKYIKRDVPVNLAE